MKTTKCILIVGLVLAMGFLVGPVAASIQIGGHVYVDWDGTHTSTAKAYTYSPAITANLYDGGNNLIGTTTTDTTGMFKWAYSGTATGPYTVRIVAPTGWTQTYPADGFTGITANINTVNFWIASNTPPSVSPTSITDTITAGGTNTESVVVTAGSEPIAAANLRTGTTDGNCGVTYSSLGTAIPANGQATLSVQVSAPASAAPGYVCSFTLQVLDLSYISGTNRVDATIPVTETVPGSVPVPEFPTVAVSILTISGMFVAVQFLKRKN